MQGVRDEVEEDDDIEDDVSCKCQFCGKYDSSFTDETLDMHYWQNCPMLMSCDECGQVRESNYSRQQPSEKSETCNQLQSVSSETDKM